MKKAPILWINVLILIFLPIATVILVPLYGFLNPYSAYEWFFFGLFMVITGLSITAGYHRLWSHRAYEAHPAVRLIFAIFGACGLQNSILVWSADHRRHHKYVDDLEKDPYSASRGFWFAHMGWILRDHNTNSLDFSNAKDLQKDPIVMWQHRNYLLIALITNSLLLIALGWFHGDLWGVFLLAGLVRIILNHHFTFFINSLAHYMGRQSFSDDNSSRDNYLMAFLTYGEGYHNYHHSFQYDYRNGVRWYHFDPAKWLIRAFSWFGLASRLRRPSKLHIEKARLSMQFKRALKHVEQDRSMETLRQHLEESYQKMVAAMESCSKLRQEWCASKREAIAAKWDRLQLKQQYRELKAELKAQRKQWRLLCLQAANSLT